MPMGFCSQLAFNITSYQRQWRRSIVFAVYLKQAFKSRNSDDDFNQKFEKLWSYGIPYFS